MTDKANMSNKAKKDNNPATNPSEDIGNPDISHPEQTAATGARPPNKQTTQDSQQPEVGFIQQLLNAKRRSMRLMKHGQKTRKDLLDRSRAEAEGVLEDERKVKEAELKNDIEKLTSEQIKKEAEYEKKTQQTVDAIQETFVTHKAQIVDNIENMVLNVKPRLHMNYRSDELSLPNVDNNSSNNELDLNQILFDMERGNSEESSSKV